MATLHAVDELSKTVALMRLMQDTGGTAHLSGPALAAVLAELDRNAAMRQRACTLAATPGLGGAAMTYAHAGRFVLGIANPPTTEVTA